MDPKTGTVHMYINCSHLYYLALINHNIMGHFLINCTKNPLISSTTGPELWNHIVDSVSDVLGTVLVKGDKVAILLATAEDDVKGSSKRS